MREAASLPGSSSLGLKRSQAEQGQPVRMTLAGHQLARALALALDASAAQEAAVVQEEAQQIQVRAAEMAAQGEVGPEPTPLSPGAISGQARAVTRVRMSGPRRP